MAILYVILFLIAALMLDIEAVSAQYLNEMSVGLEYWISVLS